MPIRHQKTKNAFFIHHSHLDEKNIGPISTIEADKEQSKNVKRPFVQIFYPLIFFFFFVLELFDSVFEPMFDLDQNVAIFQKGHKNGQNHAKQPNLQKTESSWTWSLYSAINVWVDQTQSHQQSKSSRYLKFKQGYLQGIGK